MWGLLLSALESLDLSPLSPMAYALGTSLPALNLLFSIFMTYPLAVIYDKYMEKQTPFLKHLFIISTGLDIAWFNMGLNVYHSLIAITVFILTTKVFRPGPVHVLITLVFNMVYLLMGYSYTESEDYDITWTMPHCVLVLKLIGCSFDIWDGKIIPDLLPEINKPTALRQTPSVLEVFGFVYFPAAFLVGPQFSMKRYQELVNGKYPTNNASPSNIEAAMKQGCIGLLYLAMFQVGSTIFSQEKLVSEVFDNNSFIYKHIFIGLWGKFVLYKYLACWLLTEASCIRFGIAYNGTKGGITRWDGCENVKLKIFEGTSKFGHYIDSFNVNTNFWVGKYIFRRLKFLGNRYLSQFLSLLFLAVWHGLMSGYYMTFFMEYIIMYMEKELEPMLDKLNIYKRIWSNTYSRIFLLVVLKFYTVVFMGYCMIPFDLKLFSKWFHVYKSLYFSGFLLFFPWAFLYKPALSYLIKNRILQ